MRSHLGEFEEVVLLTVAILHKNAYAIALIDEMKERLNRKVSIGSLQTVLRRLEKKGYLTSEFGEVTKVRGGKRKKYFHVTNFGRNALELKKNERMGFWDDIPGLAFE
ncbi:MAG: helix-turn-helix transcriptional regulator [Saprospiraceae bacterium]